MDLTYADDEIINRDDILMAKGNAIWSAAKKHIATVRPGEAKLLRGVIPLEEMDV